MRKRGHWSLANSPRTDFEQVLNAHSQPFRENQRVSNVLDLHSVSFVTEAQVFQLIVCGLDSEVSKSDLPIIRLV